MQLIRVGATQMAPSRRFRPLAIVAAAALLAGACSAAASSSAPSSAPAASAAPSAAPSSGTGGYGTPASAPASSAPASTPAPTAPPTTAAPAAGVDTLKAATSSTLGTYLTDGKGVTLYVYKLDHDGNPPTSTCTGGCASIWPPFVVPAGAHVAAGAGVSGKITTFTRSDGKTQVAYNGAPLYYYAGDNGPGQTNGQGIGGIWFVVKA